MKVIVTGATGRAGREAIRCCLENDRITKIFVLTRTGLSGDIESHPKVDLVLHQDFTQYSDYLLQRLAGAEACIWAIGPPSKQSGDDRSSQRRLGVDLPVAAAHVFSEKLADKTPGGVKFRFVYCSAKRSEKSKKTLVFATDTRKLANLLEKGIADVVKGHSSTFEAYALRPATFSSPEPQDGPSVPISKKLIYGLGHGSGSAAKVEPSRVGKALVVVACDGWNDKTIENDAIIQISS